jgi:hypothetical protein
MADVLGFFGVNPLRVSSVARQSPGQLRLGVVGPTGTFTLQTAAVLNAWGPMLNFTNVTGLTSLSNVTANAVEFFRLKSFP